MAYIKNEKELADLEGKLEQCSKYQTKNIQLKSFVTETIKLQKVKRK